MPITTRTFGTIDNQQITAFTLSNREGLRATIINYGGILTELHVPGHHGSSDIVLGYDTLEEYLHNPAYIGAIVGRYANRIANSQFIIEGVRHTIDANEPPNHLHGGFNGFNCQIWQAEGFTKGDTSTVHLSLRSRDGEGGFPGNLKVDVMYTLNDVNTLTVEYRATTDKATPVSLTQHSYFNLGGHDSGDICGHHLQLFADRITEATAQLLPTGRLLPVAGTPYDFQDMAQIAPDQPGLVGGFDVNYVLDAAPDELRPAAILYHPDSGRCMRVATTKPGIQLYDGTHLPTVGKPGKGGVHYPKWGGLCLETQHFPDAANQPAFPSPILRPGKQYNHLTTFSFEVK